MRFRYLTAARQELDRQIDEYEDKYLGLGEDFLDEVEAAIGWIMENPKAWSSIETGIRRGLTRRFPYGVLYHYRQPQQEIVIVAVAHTHRKPGYWKDRFKSE